MSRWGCFAPALGCFTAFACTSAEIFSTVACGSGFWPTTAAGAVSQRPMQGACRTRTSRPRTPGSSSRSPTRSGDLAGDRVAHAHRDRRRRGFPLLHHVEMVIEGRDLVDLGQRELHLRGERGEVRGREMSVAVLDAVQVLDQQVAPAGIIPKQRAYLVPRRWVDPSALGSGAHARRPASLRSGRRPVTHAYNSTSGSPAKGGFRAPSPPAGNGLKANACGATVRLSRLRELYVGHSAPRSGPSRAQHAETTTPTRQTARQTAR